VPEKTAAFANAVAQAYIDDYTENKSEVASKTVQFIDDRLNDIGEKLKQSEIALETYRTENNIINTTQETDAGIKELSQLKIQLAGLDMKEASLDNLYSYVISKRNFEEVAPNFEAFGDPLFTEMMKGLKQYTQERRELLNKYTPEHEKILLIDAKINDNIKYIKESIRNAKNDIAIKRSELFSAYDEANHRFDSLPSQEKDMVVLEREFQLNQKVYQFLVEKRTEASIAQAATISFHRIIKLAEIPVGPISPKPTMMRIIAGFLGLMIGLAIVYTRRAMRGKIEDKETVEKHSTLPIAGIIKQNTSAAEAREENFYTLSTNLILLNQIKRGTAITITSTIEKEGKTYAAINLAWALSQMGWKVLLCDMNSKQSAFDSYFDSLPANGMVNHIVSHEPIFNCCTEVNRDLFVAPIGTMYTSSSHMFSHQQLGEKIASLKRNFDIVIFDAAATSYTIDAVALMKHADLNLYIVRANLTPQHMVQHADMLKEEYQLSNLMLLINGMHQATNYSGHFTGSLYGYHKQAQNWRLRIKHYVQSYYKRAA
jgi:Mrp family chromosome partitioning ATPase